MREEFEQFIEENGLARACSGSTDDQRGISAFWFVWQKSWQASRECLMIELPERFCADPEAIDYAENVAEHIKSLGLKVKS